MKVLILSLLVLMALPSAQSSQTFTGFITDSVCTKADHSNMLMGSTDAECTIACVEAHGAKYVLFDGKDVYTLSDQKTPEKFAGKKVIVKGRVKADTKTIEVDAITAAE